jgi:hypothetical protein
MSKDLPIIGYFIVCAVIIVAMFTSLYHLSYQTGNQLERIEMMVRRTESGTQNIQIRLSHLERVLLNFDHGPSTEAQTEFSIKKKE